MADLLKNIRSHLEAIEALIQEHEARDRKSKLKIRDKSVSDYRIVIKHTSAGTMA